MSLRARISESALEAPGELLVEQVEKRPWWKGGDQHSVAANWAALQRRFPRMIPIKDPPELRTVNLCGTMLLGGRDFDLETQTYVKTTAFVLLLIPICFMGAYRVKDSPTGGWYFLGQQPLSQRARRWNSIVIPLALLTAAAWLTMTAIVPCLQQPELGFKIVGGVLIVVLAMLVLVGIIGLKKLAAGGMSLQSSGGQPIE